MMERVGTRIRIERKRNELTLAQLAGQVGISLITLQRIETGKSSPSVALLSEIAQSLNRPISSFVQDKERPFIHIKRKDQRIMSSPVLKIKLIGPRKMITDNISVTYGELKKGKSVDFHSNRGIEWTYIIEGKCEHKMNGKSIILEPGDSVSFDAKVPHSVTALGPLKFFAIYVRDMG